MYFASKFIPAGSYSAETQESRELRFNGLSAPHPPHAIRLASLNPSSLRSAIPPFRTLFHRTRTKRYSIELYRLVKENATYGLADRRASLTWLGQA